MMEIPRVNRLGWGKMGERNRGDTAFDAGEKERENIGIEAPLKWCIAGIVAPSYTPLHSCVYKAFAEDDKNRREVVRHVVVPTIRRFHPRGTPIAEHRFATAAKSLALSHNNQTLFGAEFRESVVEILGILYD